MNETFSRRDSLALGSIAAVNLGLAAVLLKAKRASAEAPNDGVNLNGLLTAEYQAIKAYTAGAAYLQSPSPDDPGAPGAGVVLAVAAHFMSQHRDHANRLIDLLNSLNATPIREEAVDYSLPIGFKASVLNVIQLAANAEKSAALAYGYVLKLLTDQQAAQVAAAIGGVESQHFIVLYLLAKGIARPTSSTLALANDIVPRSFVINVGDSPQHPERRGLESIPDFQFTP